MESWGPSSIWTLIEGKTEREIKRERNSGVREFGCVRVEGVLVYSFPQCETFYHQNSVAENDCCVFVFRAAISWQYKVAFIKTHMHTKTHAHTYITGIAQLP